MNYLSNKKGFLGIDNKFNFKEGKPLDGLWEEFYENGNVSVTGHLKNGKNDGFWEDYYENGQLKKRIYLKQAVVDGLWEEYYEDGQLKIRGNYKDGGKPNLSDKKCYRMA